jgi:RNA polymerase sigma-70 factor, ECF subfamily
MNPPDDFERLYDTLAPRLYRYALMLLTDPSGAEDAVQQVFARYATGRLDMSCVHSVEGYLRTAVRNECWRMLKRRSTRRETGLESAQILVATASASPDEAERQALEQALCQLPVEQREVVHLKAYEEMTLQQIADLFGISPNTAASRYRYAIEKLRQILHGSLKNLSP